MQHTNNKNYKKGYVKVYPKKWHRCKMFKSSKLKI